jgi:hypothetical protein
MNIGRFQATSNLTYSNTIDIYDMDELYLDLTLT